LDAPRGYYPFWSAKRLIVGIETMHMIKKRQLRCPGGQPISAARYFYAPSSHYCDKATEDDFLGFAMMTIETMIANVSANKNLRYP